ncbi:MAG: hypothetical protein K2L15_04570, partial [Eubacteriales bacterium]|nr:hypothetical protein [Eubacteriales bacterium]
RNTTNARKKKKRNNVIISRIFTTIIFFLIISYFGVSVYKSLSRKPVTYETIKHGTIDNQKLAKGVIIRDETVYKAGRSGSLEFYKPENERVKKGEYIVSIKDQGVIQNTEQELEEINEKILEIQENREELSLFSEDAKKVDAQIQTVLENGIYEFAKNDMSSIYEIKGNVQKKLDIRNQMLLSETGGSISELANKKNEKEQTINANTQKIAINEGGILSYYVDGLEEAFSIENLDNITAEQTKMQADKLDELLNYKVQTLEGEPVFKIVESNEFYIASYVKTDYINDWQEGDFRNIYINDEGQYKPQEVKVEKIILEDKESYILMKSTKNLIDFIDTRSITFEINKPKEGFKINNTAIAEKNFLKIPLTCIIDDIITKKTEDGTIIKIFLQDFEINELEKVAYVPVQYGDLNVGDTLTDHITNSEVILKDIFTTKGIYVVNSGIYEFKKINLENSVSNEEFTILDPTINPNIRIYDRFIPDAKSILKEEPIYN